MRKTRGLQKRLCEREEENGEKTSAWRIVQQSQVRQGESWCRMWSRREVRVNR